ncbi:hypothetical protein SNQ28_000664 [Cronobacter malonaticus]|nr:hypothetical protein [Cronobacter malonaticus]ELY6256647.1 hypothetical protein [Cronobacter malonaticus]
MAEHSVQEVAIGFVCLVSFDDYADIVATVESRVSALMDKGADIAVKDTDKVKVFVCVFVLVVPTGSSQTVYRSDINIQMLTGLRVFFSTSGKVNICRVEQWNEISRELRPFGLCHDLLALVI